MKRFYHARFPSRSVRPLAGSHRRGVLLLVVLSMLTLFLMLGTAYLVVSTRSRETARAFSRMVMQSDAVRIPHTALLDAAFLKLARGNSGTSAPTTVRTSGIIPLLNLTVNSGTFTNTPSTSPPSVQTVFESILADKYGSTVSGSATVAIGTGTVVDNTPLLYATATIPGIDLTAGSTTGNRPAGIESTFDLVGRVVTILGSGREPTSHRVLKAASNGSNQVSLWLTNPPRTRPFSLPSGTVPIVVNGRDFSTHDALGGLTTNEAWDAFDDANPFLAHVAPSDKAHASGSESVSSSVVKRVGFVPASSGLTALTGNDATGLPYGADNDNDGVVDGFFFDIGLPNYYKTNGDEVHIDVSALVVDLDSRFNINAHGSLEPDTYCSGSSNFHANWARGTITSGSVPNLTNMPLGSGYGPPEVNGNWMFSVTNSSYSQPSIQSQSDIYSSNVTSGENPDTAIYSGIQAASQIGQRPSSSRFTSGQPTPRTGSVEGRYAEAALGRLSGTTSIVNLVTTGTESISSATFALARPGAPDVDDRLSSISDRAGDQVVLGSQVNGGVPSEWWDGTTTYDWQVAASGSAQPAPRGVYNSPPDLHGRMITTSSTSSTSAVPQLAFAKPDWGATETKDDPYELRLDRSAPRNMLRSSLTSAVDNIFTPAELESVLRPYDRDSLQLPARLQAVLGSSAEEARLRITTDSWDTTAVTGSAATVIRKWVKDAIDGGSFSDYAGISPVTGLIGGEIARGERFNLNRPFTANKPASYSVSAPYYVQRQAYFKDLFVLLVALGKAPNATTAQWAANVVDFRDADSTMTPFEYDNNPANGWDIDNDVTTNDGSSRGVVWGAERPEAVIAATSAWENSTTGELFVLLHRPWNSQAYIRTSGTTSSVAGEPIDVGMDTLVGGVTENQMSLYRKSTGLANDFDDASLYPVWRMRIDDGNGNIRYARFDIKSSLAATDEMVPANNSPNPDTAPKLGPDSWLCLMGNNTIPMTVSTGTTVTSGTVLMSGSSFRVPGTLPAAGVNTPPKRTATIYLERLSDPSGTATNTAWTQDPLSAQSVPMYRVVDQATIEVVNREPLPMQVPALPSVTLRPMPAFWSWPSSAVASTQTSTFGANDFYRSGNGAMWFPWSNRPFASSTELLLVPNMDALGMLQSYVQPATIQQLPALSGTAIPNGLFDAVHIPTRFAGIHTTTGSTAVANLAGAGIYQETTPANQISSYREPGRVNLNTVTSDDVWNAVVAGSLQTSGSAMPVLSRSSATFETIPATTMHAVLALSGSVTFPASGNTPPRQDSHALLTPLQQLNQTHSLYTATRLANTATVRSNVFGIWITVRESVANDPDSIKLHRAFYIFDRSIPVGFEPGKDHNVWDAVLLRRIIE